jgi:hypothetical protein
MNGKRAKPNTTHQRRSRKVSIQIIVISIILISKHAINIPKTHHTVAETALYNLL